eukprot:403346740
MTDLVRESGAPFAMKLLRTADRVGGKLSKSKLGYHSPIDIKTLTERVFLKIIEDINDKNKIDNYTLLQIVYLFEQYCYDSETTNKVTKEVYDEIIRRGHTLTEYQIGEMEQAFSKISQFRGVNFYPKIQKDIKARIGRASVNAFVSEQIGLWKSSLENKSVACSYIQEKQRLTLNIDGIRYSLQNIENDNLTDFHLIVESLSREQMDSVHLCLPMRGKNVLKTSHEADLEIVKYLKHEKRFKIGETERVIYQKVNKLRTPNAQLSILYAKTSDSEVQLNSKIGLIIPDIKWNIEQAYKHLIDRNKTVDKYFNNLKYQIMLDQFEWASDLTQQKACPSCNLEKVNYGPEFYHPFIKHLTSKEINKEFLHKRIAENIIDHAERYKKQGEPYRNLVFLDEKYCSVFDIAKQIIKIKVDEQPKTNNDKPLLTAQDALNKLDSVLGETNDMQQTNKSEEQKPISTEDYIKLGFLFEGYEDDKIFKDNAELAKKYWGELCSRDKFEFIEDHKYDYKCYPFTLLQKNNFYI